MASRISNQAFAEALLKSVSEPDFDRLLQEFPGRGLEEFTTSTGPYKLGGNRKRVKHDMEHSKFIYTLESTYILTEVLLTNSFGLDIKLSRQHLCPRLPNRLDYIYWIFFDLLGYINEDFPRITSRPSQNLLQEVKPNVGITGLDIGTGSSCIYPLLGTSISQQAKFIATDINTESLGICASNLEKNFYVKSRIELILKKPEDPLFGHLSELQGESPPPAKDLDFSMCNPPFYESSQELIDLQALKESSPPFMDLAAVDNELYTPGGEVQFIRRMVDESLFTKDTITWYTTLIGKKSSLFEVVEYLKSKNIVNFCIHEIAFGSTKRWTLAWTFTAYHGKTKLTSAPLRSLVPLVTYQKLLVPVHLRGSLLDLIQAELINLYLSTSWLDLNDNPLSPDYHNHIDIITHGDVWSRSFRRKSHELRASQLNDSSNIARFRLQWTTAREPVILDTSSHDENGNEHHHELDTLGLWWVYGYDFKVFESFHGFINRLISGIRSGEMSLESSLS